MLGVLGMAVLGVIGCTDDGGPGDPGPKPLVISPETGPRVCPVEPDVECAHEVGERLPLEATGTIERGDGYGGSRCGVGGGDAVDDIAFRWTAPAEGDYRIETAGSTYDTVLSVRMGSCEGREIVCNDDVREGDVTSSLVLHAAACAVVTIVVDGASVDVGDFRVTVHGTEQVCDDGMDEDGDGATDCDDRDCFGRVCPGEDRWLADWAALEWEAFDLINGERSRGATCGGTAYPPAPALEMDTFMRDAARWHSQDMTDQGYFSHDSLDGRMLGDRVADAGWHGSGPLGENIAAGSSNAAETVAGWMASDGHCTNIMNPAYHVTGIGYADGPDGPKWTQDFGGSF